MSQTPEPEPNLMLEDPKSSDPSPGPSKPKPKPTPENLKAKPKVLKVNNSSNKEEEGINAEEMQTHLRVRANSALSLILQIDDDNIFVAIIMNMIHDRIVEYIRYLEANQFKPKTRKGRKGRGK